jgi:hypothetical protein
MITSVATAQNWGGGEALLEPVEEIWQFFFN